MLHLFPLRMDPATGQMYLKEDDWLGKSIFMINQIMLGCFTIFGTYRSIAFLVISDNWDPILSPVTLIMDTVGYVAVINMYVLLANVQKGVKLYNGLFNLNEDKGHPRSKIHYF